MPCLLKRIGFVDPTDFLPFLAAFMTITGIWTRPSINSYIYFFRIKMNIPVLVANVWYAIVISKKKQRVNSKKQKRKRRSCFFPLPGLTKTSPAP